MKSARVLVVHNRYQRPGGEDAVVDAEIELLRCHGHAVATYMRDNNELTSMPAARALAQTLWSRRTYQDIAQFAREFQPDVIHAHNTFALVSSSLYWVAARWGIPVVQTLHNFRLLCVQAMFLRERRVCEDCLGRVPWRGIARGCYRGSSLQSATLATMLTAHRALGTYRDKVSWYIALNDFCRRKFIEGGLPESRIAIKPNFVDIEPPPEGPRHGGLYVGRIASEKGIDTLCAALRELPWLTIDVIGSGPEERELAGNPQVRLLGWLAPRQVYERMRGASYLIMPSLWYENCPRTLIEAYANRLPVIASRLGALSELVSHGSTGLLFEPGSASDLARHMAWAEMFPAKMRAMGEKARDAYERKYTSARNYEQLMAVYEHAMATQRLRAAV